MSEKDNLTNVVDDSAKADEQAKSAVKETDNGVDDNTDDEDDEKLGDAGKKALIAERNRAKEAEKRAAELAKRIEEFEDSQRTDEEKRARAVEKLNNDNSDLQKNVEKLQRELLIRDVIEEVGLPKSLAPRLQGESKEDLIKDAEQLKDLFRSEDDGEFKVRKPAPVRQVNNSNEGKISNADRFAQLASEVFNK